MYLHPSSILPHIYYLYPYPRMISTIPYSYPFSSSSPCRFERMWKSNNGKLLDSTYCAGHTPNTLYPPVGREGRLFITKNQERIITLRSSTGFNDAEALALMFEDKEIADDRTLPGRLKAILDATESKIVPGLQTGIEFQDVGFKGDRNHGGKGFKDPHPSSRNQVGHFLTAVGLAFRPETVSRHVLGIRMRDHIGIPKELSDDDVALRLTIGHELSPDPNVLLAGILGAAFPPGLPLGGASAAIYYEIWNSYRNQFFSVKPEDIAAFVIALNALGTNPLLNMDLAEVALLPIFLKIRVQERGNSYQDLRLSLVGWYLGKAILQGRFTTGAQVAEWIRRNLKE